MWLNPNRSSVDLMGTRLDLQKYTFTENRFEHYLHGVLLSNFDEQCNSEFMSSEN